MDPLEGLKAALEREGLNHMGVIGRARYDAAAPAPFRADVVHPEARSIVVVGSGGRAHWQRFLVWVGADPVRRLARSNHPLDDFTAATFASLGPRLEGCRTLFPTADCPVQLDFMRMGALAGLGAPSELGILVSDRFGPWFGLRAAVFTPWEQQDGAAYPTMCTGCRAPCKDASPPPSADRWRANAAGRLACVVAPDHRYDSLEIIYHYDRPRGRQALCERFGVRDE